METCFFTLTALFALGGSLGWVLELLYRRAAHGKWVNPGFLAGPCLPLYGVGLILLYLICRLDLHKIRSSSWQKIVLILLITVAMTTIEFLTGLFFTRRFHVRLWDYSARPGNIDGLICPLFTLIWGVLGAAYALLLHPRIVRWTQDVIQSRVCIFLLGIYLGIFILDICYSFHVAAAIQSWAARTQLVVRYENLKLSVLNRAEELHQKRSFVFPLRSRFKLNEELDYYLDRVKTRLFHQ